MAGEHAEAPAASASGSGGVRIRWFVLGVPVYAVGAALAQVLGEVVGEAWGGDFLHLSGHAIGTVIHIGLVVLVGAMLLRNHVFWAKPWAAGAIIGAFVGFGLYLAVLLFATEPEELIIALSLHLPLISAAVSQSIALRGHLQSRRRWATAWLFAVLLGVGAAWFAAGGVDGISAGSPYPVFEKAVHYWWRMIPTSLLGATLYASLSAVALPIPATSEERQDRVSDVDPAGRRSFG